VVADGGGVALTEGSERGIAREGSATVGAVVAAGAALVEALLSDFCASAPGSGISLLVSAGAAAIAQKIKATPPTTGRKRAAFPLGKAVRKIITYLPTEPRKAERRRITQEDKDAPRLGEKGGCPSARVWNLCLDLSRAISRICCFLMTPLPTATRFSDQKYGFRQVLSDRHWPAKVLLGGFLLINPFLVALAPAYFSGHSPGWVQSVFPWLFGFNVLSFWFPLGFTYEVLRRARFGRGVQLPEWRCNKLRTFAYEGAIKLIIAVFTLIVPVGVWMGAIYLVFDRLLGLPDDLLTMAVPPIMLFVIPLCGVACCRWLDGASVWDCAFNYAANLRAFRKGCPDYLIASAFIVGVNAVTTSFFYTIPFGAVFGLCLVDMWFGPIYAESVAKEKPATKPQRQPALV
jgi:hypothetical protein